MEAARTHRRAPLAAWRRNAVPENLQRGLRLATVGVPLACDLARSGSKLGTASFQVEMRQPVYDGCAADRTQAVLQGFRALRRVAPNHRTPNRSVVDRNFVGPVVRHPDEACKEALPETPQWRRFPKSPTPANNQSFWLLPASGPSGSPG